MTRTVDPFPRQGRIRGEYTTLLETDPLEIAFARREAEKEAAKERVKKGITPDADPQDLRGIPVVGRGVGGTSPGTNPYQAVDRLDR